MTLNIPALDSEMKSFILDCAKEQMSVTAICDELYRQGFFWVEEDDGAFVIGAGRDV